MSDQLANAPERVLMKDQPPIKTILQVLEYLVDQPSCFVLEQLRLAQRTGVDDKPQVEADLLELYKQYNRHEHDSPALHEVLHKQDILQRLANRTQDGPMELQNDVQTVKRGRGRPRKDRGGEMDNIGALTPLAKRGRGRPRKEPGQEKLNAGQITTQVKRGRGRPRKTPMPESSAVGVVPLVKRGRGRPRKTMPRQELNTGELTAMVKRGRGRPPKTPKC